MWEIQTYTKSWRIQAGHISNAFKWAWGKNPPRTIGRLARYRTVDGIKLGQWQYLDSVAALKWAGYDVETPKKSRARAKGESHESNN